MQTLKSNLKNIIIQYTDNVLYRKTTSVVTQVCNCTFTSIFTSNIYSYLFMNTLSFNFFLIGVYKPRVRCYETSELCMKFERCLDSESEYSTTYTVVCQQSLPILIEGFTMVFS